MKFSILLILFLPLTIIFAASAGEPIVNVAKTRKFSEIRYIENKGQWESPELFRANLPMGKLFVEKNALTYVLEDPYQNSECQHPGGCSHEPEGDKSAPHLTRCHAIKMHFRGSNPDVKPIGQVPDKTYHNYFYGQDPSHWASHVQLYGTVVYPEIYSGIDMKLNTKDIHFKYEFIVHPGANPDQIDIFYEGANGLLIENGNLIIQNSVNDLTEQKPFAYQLSGRDTLVVPCEFVISGNQMHFSFPSSWRQDLELVIDPVVVASTYAGSMGASTYGHSASYDDDGNIYTGGRSFGSGYPTTTGAFQTNFGGGTDVGISKFNPTGTTLLWATYLGGNSSDNAHSLVTNGDHELFIYGSTSSTNFPVSSGCFQNLYGGGASDIFVTRLSEDGATLLGSTYVGGSAADGSNSLAVNYGDSFRGEIILDNSGNPCIASFSSSGNFPMTPGVFDPTYNGGQDGVVFKFNAGLTTLVWSTYLGGNADDAAYGLKLNDIDMVYVTGGTQSQNFNFSEYALHQNYMGGTHDGFIFILWPDVTFAVAGTYIGTAGFDESFFIQMDDENSVYVYGQSDGGIPVTPGCYGNPGSYQFIYKLDQTLSEVIYSTVFGNGNNNGKLTPTAFLVDLCQNVYAAGWGITTGFPVSPNAVQPNTDGQDFYIMVLERDAPTLLYATYFGSSAWEHVDGGTSRFDKKGIVYEAVCEGSPNFPVSPGAYAPTSSVGWDLAVFKIDFQLSGPTAQIGVNGGNQSGCAPFDANFSNASLNANNYVWNFGDNSPESTEEAPFYTYNTPGIYTAYCIAIDSSSCFLTDTAYLTITVLAPPDVNLGSDTLICHTPDLTLTAGNPGCTFVWSTFETSAQITVNQTGSFWVTADNGECIGRDTILVEFIPPPALGPDISVCENVPVILDPHLPGYQYFWSTNETSETIQANQTGTYWVNTIREYCTLSDTIEVFFKPLPDVDLGDDRLICEGDTAIFRAGNPGALYTWNTGGTNANLVAGQTGQYWVQVNLDGCLGYDTANLSVNPVPVVDLMGDRLMCEFDTLTLDAGNPGFNYLWSTGATTQWIQITDSGYYSVTVSASDCAGYDTIYAEKIILRIELGSDTLICPGESITLDAGVDDVEYLWNTGQTAKAINVSTNGTYWVKISEYLCSASDTIHVGSMENLVLPEQLNLCGNEFLILSTDIDADDFLWSSGEITPTIEIREPGLYTLVATKEQCKLSDSTLVIGTSGIQALYIPNTFTPNLDSHNESFGGIGTGILSYEMIIFNRWGEVLFETKDLLQGWDGTYKGSVVPSGIYYYFIRYSTECSFDQEFKVTGTLMVLK